MLGILGHPAPDVDCSRCSFVAQEIARRRPGDALARITRRIDEPSSLRVDPEPNWGYGHPIPVGGMTRMHHLRQENLPFVGSSHEFVGAEHGDTGVSVFLFHGKPGSGPGPHRHPYDEIQFIREGRGVWTVNGKSFEGSAGDIFVIKAGEIHSFKAVGDSPLVQVDVHLSPRFIQENL